MSERHPFDPSKPVFFASPSLAEWLRLQEKLGRPTGVTNWTEAQRIPASTAEIYVGKLADANTKKDTP